MVSFDPQIFATAMRKIVGEIKHLKDRVEFLEDENAKLRRRNEELATHLLGLKRSLGEDLQVTVREMVVEHLARGQDLDEAEPAQSSA